MEGVGRGAGWVLVCLEVLLPFVVLPLLGLAGGWLVGRARGRPGRGALGGALGGGLGVVAGWYLYWALPRVDEAYRTPLLALCVLGGLLVGSLALAWAATWPAKRS